MRHNPSDRFQVYGPKGRYLSTNNPNVAMETALEWSTIVSGDGSRRSSIMDNEMYIVYELSNGVVVSQKDSGTNPEREEESYQGWREERPDVDLGDIWEQAQAKADKLERQYKVLAASGTASRQELEQAREKAERAKENADPDSASGEPPGPRRWSVPGTPRIRYDAWLKERHKALEQERLMKELMAPKVKPKKTEGMATKDPRFEAWLKSRKNPVPEKLHQSSASERNIQLRIWKLLPKSARDFIARNHGKFEQSTKKWRDGTEGWMMNWSPSGRGLIVCIYKHPSGTLKYGATVSRRGRGFEAVDVTSDWNKVLEAVKSR